MMGMKRILAVGLIISAFAGAANAEFDGPAPLAWRWIQANSNSPVGSPTVKDGVVYTAVGTRMYALDKESGNQKWKYPNVDPIEGYFKSKVLLADGMAIAAASNKSIYAVDEKTGETKWTYVAPVNIYREPVIVGKFVVFGMTDNTLMAVNLSDGQAAWANPVKVFDGFLGKLGSYQNNVYYFTNNYELVCYSVTTQKEIWKQRFSVIGPDAEPVSLSDNLYMNSGTYVIGVSAVSKRKVFEANSNAQLAFAPASNGETVLAVDQDGKVFLFGSNGRPVNTKKQVDLGSQPSTSPSVVGKFYAVPTRNGAMNLIDSKTGDVAWSYLVRPIGDGIVTPPTGGGPGGGPGGFGGGRPGGGGTQTTPTRVLALPAAGPAVLDGDTLLLMTVDGSVLAFDKNHGVDLTPPTVKMNWPNPGDLVSGQPPLELIFKIDDEASGINTSTLKVLVDGQEMEHEFGRDGFAVVRISSLGKNKPLSNGRKVITVVVSDWLGNQARAEFTLVIDNTLRPLQRPSGNTTGGPGGPGGPGGLGGGRGGPGGFGGGNGR